MKILKTILFFGFCFFTTSTVFGQAVECSGFWVLYGVPLTEPDSEALLNLLSHVHPQQSYIIHNTETNYSTYGGLELEDVTLLEGGEFSTDTELRAHWFMDMRITPLFFSSKAITWEGMSQVDPAVAEQVDEILSKYSN